MDEQLVVSLINNVEDEKNIRTGLYDLNNIIVKVFNNFDLLLNSSDYNEADVFIVSVDMGVKDGRDLYLKQVDRLRIVPFLFIIDRPVNDDDWDLSSISLSDNCLYDYLEKPYSVKKLKQRVTLMLTINNLYNKYTMDTTEGLRLFWKESIIQDRKILRKMRELYRKEK